MAARKWDAETVALIARFKEIEPAASEFELRSGVTVIDPAKFHEALRAEIALGPVGARSRLGGLKDDLRDYLARRP